MPPPASTVERARRDDVAPLLEIANAAAVRSAANFATAPEPLEKWLATFDDTEQRYPWLVAREAGQVIAFAKAGPYRVRGAYAWTTETTVYVAPEAHGRGLGTALYARLLALLRAQGYVTAFAAITTPHPPSEALHAAMGFQRVGTLRRAGWKFSRWHDVGFWELALQGDGAPRPLRSVSEVWTLAP